MTRHRISRLAATLPQAVLLAVMLLFSAALANGVLAQGVSTDPAQLQTADTAEDGDTETAEVSPETSISAAASGVDLTGWESTAARAAALSELGYGSDFALNRLRADLADWREIFLAQSEVNSGRLETVAAQIAALGAANDGQTLAPSIEARFEALAALQARLSAPATLAAERYAHADGLISELDALSRNRHTRELLKRGTSPLAPANWSPAIATLYERVSAVWAELSATIASPERRAALPPLLPAASLAFLVGFIFLLRGKRWFAALGRSLPADAPGLPRLWRALVSLGQVLLPVIGLAALAWGLTATGLFGFRARELIQLLPYAGLYPILAHWLAERVFSAPNAPLMDADANPAPLSDETGITTAQFVHTAGGPLRLDAKHLGRTQRLVVQVGWLISALTLAGGLLASGDTSPEIEAVLLFPIQVMIALALYRFGQIMIQQAGAFDRPGGIAAPVSAATGQPISYWRGLMRLSGRAIMTAALSGLVLGALGYGAAESALIVPMVKTLALIGVAMVMQRLFFELATLVTGASVAKISGPVLPGSVNSTPQPKGRNALIPVLIGFIPYLVALPILALTWGARVEDLGEIWTRFNEGYSWGDTKISPNDFLALVLIFVAGYGITRLVQGALRATILPNTQLDIGARNAIVAGTGYFGIFLAAMLAIVGAGVDLSSLAIVAGALSVGIGFGLQNIVSNFVSGIILLIERPISEGDWIEAGGQMGIVRSISVRSTRIETFDRTDVIVPNADLVTGQVTNWTRGNSVGRIIVTIGVAYGNDTARIQGILQEIAEANPMVLLAPPPSVLFMAFGADSLDFEMRLILRDINNSLTVRSEINHAIAARFAKEGIEIPFAQRDVWLRNPEALRPSD